MTDQIQLMKLLISPLVLGFVHKICSLKKITTSMSFHDKTLNLVCICGNYCQLHQIILAYFLEIDWPFLGLLKAEAVVVTWNHLSKRQWFICVWWLFSGSLIKILWFISYFANGQTSDYKITKTKLLEPFTTVEQPLVTRWIWEMRHWRGNYTTWENVIKD